MGNAIGSFVDYCPDSLARTISGVYNGRKGKRKRELKSKEEAELLENLHQPKTKKLLSTAQYIYQALFVDGKDSDVTVNILNKDWKLHKVYLEQSQYFSSMFSGSWNESNKDYINIVVTDPNITLEALSIVFGSFYLDEVKLEPCLVVGVIAASTMFQMDGLIEQCCEIMYESVSPVTAVQYYQAACSYGLQKLKEKLLNWFLINIIDYYGKNLTRLKEINVDLMCAIISNPGLCMIQTEMSLYHLLRKWLFLKMNPNINLSVHKTGQLSGNKFFRSIKGEQAFLLTTEGLPYLNVFQNLRLENLVLNACDITCVTADRIIPESWLVNAYKKQWLAMLNIFNGNKGVTNIDENVFMKSCFRCGRVIHSGDILTWRWSGFAFGIDLVWSINNNVLSFKRQQTQLEFSNNNLPHHIILKVEVMNLDEQRQIKRIAKTGMMNVSLTRGQEMSILRLDKDFEFPMYISVNLLLYIKEKPDGKN